MIALFNWLVKITGWLPQKLCFKTKVYYEDKKAQSRRIKGPAIIISNHTSVYDYAVMMFVFFSRTLRYQMAEVLFKKRGLSGFLRALGGIEVNRDTHETSCIDKSERILKKGGVVGIFPEGRLAKEGETPPIEFKTGAAALALMTGVKLIPAYTDGNYFGKKRARVIIGKPIDARELYDDDKTYRQNLNDVTVALRQKIIDLGELLGEKQKG
ncbi:MAG: 1-acyl-sn-glycerol-3-phosphate acyltransferase [Clostridiales bacterium]|nr:1-acyl-sn-glycerol-3-phosphate acyltransferase [Clostridiales bacterium]